ncbi:MAG TPA: hypothetical protein VGE53_01830 [Candidatus Paceibacterota bacterium]
MLDYAFPLGIMATAAIVTLAFWLQRSAFFRFNHERRKDDPKVNTHEPSWDSFKSFVQFAMIAMLGAFLGSGEPIVLDYLQREPFLRTAAVSIIVLWYGCYALVLSARSLISAFHLLIHFYNVEAKSSESLQQEHQRFRDQADAAALQRANEAAASARAEAAALRAELEAERAGRSAESTPTVGDAPPVEQPAPEASADAGVVRIDNRRQAG